jgi:hypothetical protein
MREEKMQNLTLLAWTLEIWSDYRRGIPVQGHHAVIAQCMEQHREWWNDWDSAHGTDHDHSITNRLLHIHNDAAVKTQIETGAPKEVKTFYEALREKGFTEFESIHSIGIAMSEENAYAREHNEMFSQQRYVQGADRYVKETLSRPNLTRLTKAKAY